MLQMYSCAMLFTVMGYGQSRVSMGRITLELMIALSKLAGSQTTKKVPAILTLIESFTAK